MRRPSPREIRPEDYGLSEARRAELAAAFRGAYAVLWLGVLVGATACFAWALTRSVEGLGMMLGMLALAGVSGLLLMLFLTAPVKLVVRALLRALQPEFDALFRYEAARRAALRHPAEGGGPPAQK